MKIEDQVCSLELAKNLKKLGLKQESYFNYELRSDRPLYFEIYHSKPTSCAYEYYSAFTASELGEILPNCILIPEREPFGSFRINICKFNSVHEVGTITSNYVATYDCDSTEAAGENAWLRRSLMANIYDPNLANCLAKMLICLIERKLIEI